MRGASLLAAAPCCCLSSSSSCSAPLSLSFLFRLRRCRRGVLLLCRLGCCPSAEGERGYDGRLSYVCLLLPGMRDEGRSSGRALMSVLCFPPTASLGKRGWRVAREPEEHSPSFLHPAFLERSSALQLDGSRDWTAIPPTSVWVYARRLSLLRSLLNSGSFSVSAPDPSPVKDW